MSRRLRGEFYFRIPDLLTAPDQLGRAFVLRLPGARADVVLPRSNDDASFRLSKRTDVEEFDDHVRIEYLVVEDHDDIQAVRTLKVVVRLEHGDDDEEAWKDATRNAEEALRRFVDWVRIETAQAAITAGPDRLRPLRDSTLEDETTGAQLLPLTATSAFRTITLRFPPEPRRLDDDAADAVAEALERPPPLPDRLLADARHALWYSTPADVGKALVLMGSALELKAKETARRLGLAGGKRIEDATFHELITKRWEVFFGRSLEAEDPPLFGAVTAAYRARNRFAHSSELPDWKGAALHLDAAARALSWLGRL